MDKPVNIVHVVHSLDVGGLENGVVNLLNRLDHSRFAHTVCCLAQSGQLARRIAQERVKIVEIGCSAHGFRFPLVTLMRLFRDLKADVVHTRGWAAVDAVFAARLAGVKAVIHGEHGREWTDAQGANWKRNQIRRIVGLLVSHYVVVCDFFSEWLRHTCKVPGRKIIHIPNGVDTEKFHPLEVNADAPGARSELRGRLGLPVDGLLVGAVGRLDPVKDFPTLLRGFAQLSCQFPQARLVIVGDGPIRAELTDLARALDLAPRVLWVGAQEDVASFLRCFDLFVQCSIFEGMSNTILEAMATGLPVVASTTGGNGELVVGGANGFLFPVGDVEALTRALAKYASNQALRELHAAQSRQRALEHFNLSLMTSRYSSLYEAAVRSEL